MTSSQEYNAIAANITLFPEANSNSIYATEATLAEGVFIKPSPNVIGRPADITGYVLKAVNSDGKIEWSVDSGGNPNGPNLSIQYNDNGIFGGDANLTWDGTSMRIAGEINVVANNFESSISASSVLAVDTSFVLPPNNGTNGFVLQTDGAGVTSWVPVTATAAGANTQIQYNNAGLLGADANLTWDGASLGVTGNITHVGLFAGASITLTGTISAVNLRTSGVTPFMQMNGNDITGVNSIQFLESGGDRTEGITLNSPVTMAANYSLTLPNVQGGAGQVLSNDGAGNLTWADNATAPAGANTEVQYNNAGSFGASSNFTFVGGNTLNVSTGTNVGTINCDIFNVGSNFGVVNSGDVSVGASITLVAATGQITGTTVKSTSDVNLKKNINLLSNSLDRVERIEPYEFNWKNNPDQSKIYGVIAQQLESAELNNIVSEINNVKYVDYNQIIPLLIGSIKELSNEIKQLKNKN